MIHIPTGKILGKKEEIFSLKKRESEYSTLGSQLV